MSQPSFLKFFILLVTLTNLHKCGATSQVLGQRGRSLAQFSSAQPYTITSDATYISFTFNDLTLVPTSKFYHVAVDTDACACSGFTGFHTSLGAEFMIESATASIGASCAQAPQAYKFTGLAGSGSWSWASLSPVAVLCVKTTTALTWKFPLATFNSLTTTKPNVINVCQASQALFDGTVISGILPVKPVTSCVQGIIVPAYFDAAQTTKWNQVLTPKPTAAAPRYVIINPFNGDGDVTLFGTYKTVVAQAKTAGVGVLGYAYTRNGVRNITAVLDSINKYYTVLGSSSISGIFLDEANVLDCTASLDYYKTLSTAIRAKAGKVVLNPGMYSLPECFFSSNVADMAMVFEQPVKAYATGFAPTAYQAKYKANRFIHAVYSTPAGDAALAVRNSKWRGAGWVYVTDDGLDGNPWDSVASYWTTEVANTVKAAV